MFEKEKNKLFASLKSFSYFLSVSIAVYFVLTNYIYCLHILFKNSFICYWL